VGLRGFLYAGEAGDVYNKDRGKETEKEKTRKNVALNAWDGQSSRTMGTRCLFQGDGSRLTGGESGFWGGVQKGREQSDIVGLWKLSGKRTRKGVLHRWRGTTDGGGGEGDGCSQLVKGGREPRERRGVI